MEKSENDSAKVVKEVVDLVKGLNGVMVCMCGPDECCSLCHADKCKKWKEEGKFR